MHNILYILLHSQKYLHLLLSLTLRNWSNMILTHDQDTLVYVDFCESGNMLVPNVNYWNTREIKCCFFWESILPLNPPAPQAFPRADLMLAQLQSELDSSAASTEYKPTETARQAQGGRAAGPLPGSWHRASGLARRDRQEQDLLPAAVCSCASLGATWYPRFSGR